MKDLALNSGGDLLIENNDLVLITGAELLQQEVECILGTNKGEWFNDWDEGIVFSNILGKDVTDEEIRTEVTSGLSQVDETFALDEFEVIRENRTAYVKFKAHNADGETVSIEHTFE